MTASNLAHTHGMVVFQIDGEGFCYNDFASAWDAADKAGANIHKVRITARLAMSPQPVDGQAVTRIYARK